jgi:hypothetical protein
MESIGELKKYRNILGRVKPAVKIVKSFSYWGRKDVNVWSTNKPPLINELLRKIIGYLFILKNKPRMFSRGIFEGECIHPCCLIIIVIIELGIKRLGQFFVFGRVDSLF